MRSINNNTLSENNLYPSAPLYDCEPSYSYNPNFSDSVSDPPHHAINVPPLVYTVPGTFQPHTNTPVALLPQAAAILPVPRNPDAPLLHEVNLTEERQRLRCPFCYSAITTKTKFAIGTMTHIVAAAFIFAVVSIPIFWIAYVVDCCKDVDHACPSCGKTIGKFRRFT